MSYFIAFLFSTAAMQQSPTRTLRTDVVQTSDGPIAVTSKFSPSSRKSHNWWNERPATQLFSKDEGGGSLPAITKKGSL